MCVCVCVCVCVCFTLFIPPVTFERIMFKFRILNIRIPYGKIADPYFFLVRDMPLSGEMIRLKNDGNLVSMISQKPFELRR